MTKKVGIPQALLYYYFSELWQTFFENLDMEVIFSGKTNKSILDMGLAQVVDEACLPVKVFFGHAALLGNKNVDFIFVPRIVSIEKKAYICPKMMGLPDMLEASSLKLPPLIKPTMNKISSQSDEPFLRELGKYFKKNIKTIRIAWEAGLRAQAKHELAQLQMVEKDMQAADCTNGETVTIMVIGHQYNLYDGFLNLNILDKLRHLGCRVITPEQIPREVRNASIKDPVKPIFWTYGRTLLGSVAHFSSYEDVKGVVILASFGCGIDSFMGNMITRRLHRQGIPFLNLTLDEHTGEAGLNTRIEAFVDLLRWRMINHEDNFSPYGQHMGSHEGDAGIHGAYRNYAAPYQ